MPVFPFEKTVFCKKWGFDSYGLHIVSIYFFSVCQVVMFLGEIARERGTWCPNWLRLFTWLTDAHLCHAILILHWPSRDICLFHVPVYVVECGRVRVWLYGCIEDEINFLFHFCHFYLFCSILWPIKEVFCALQTRLPLRHLRGYGLWQARTTSEGYPAPLSSLTLVWGYENLLTHLSQTIAKLHLVSLSVAAASNTGP